MTITQPSSVVMPTTIHRMYFCRAEQSGILKRDGGGGGDPRIPLENPPVEAWLVVLRLVKLRARSLPIENHRLPACRGAEVAAGDRSGAWSS